MKLDIPVTKETRFNWYIEILGCISPFRDLRPREREVLAELYRINFENSSTPEEPRNRIVFHKDSRKRIAEKLGITVQTVYTIMLSLREKGILGDDCFTKKYVLGNIDNIQFYFIDK